MLVRDGPRMAFTQSDVDTLRQSIATGARRVRYADGRDVEYRSYAEMRRVLTDMEAELAGTARTLADDRVVTGVATGMNRGAPSYGWPYPGRLIP